MDNKKVLDELASLRALGQLVVERSYKLERELGLVQVPAPRKGFVKSAAAKVIQKRNSKLLKN